MRILVVGAGGVGGYYGARLLHAGHDVAFVARGANVEALRTKGLRLTSTHGDVSFDRVEATERASDERAAAVLFCVKTYDNDGACDVMSAAVGDGTAICSLQNGVENEAFLRSRFPQAIVLGGVSRIEAWLEEPGHVVQRGAIADMTVGAFRDEDSPAARALVDAFDGTPVPATVSDDITRDLWQKLLIICGMSVTAYCRCSVGDMRQDEALLSLSRRCMVEVAAVAEAHGIQLVPGLPEMVLTSLQTALEPTAKSSMARDVEAGRPLEVEALNGAVVRFGREHGVDTPANQTILDALLPLHRAAMERRAVARPDR